MRTECMCVPTSTMICLYSGSTMLCSVLHQQGEGHLVHLGHIGQSGLLSGANKRDGEE